MDIIQIGFFQFDNLVRNRIPFLLLHEGFSFEQIYNSLETEALNRWSLNVEFGSSFDQVLKRIQEQKIPTSMPVVLLSKSGEQGKDWVPQLESAGFTNVFYMFGGWDALIQEAKESL